MCKNQCLIPAGVCVCIYICVCVYVCVCVCIKAFSFFLGGEWELEVAMPGSQSLSFEADRFCDQDIKPRKRVQAPGRQIKNCPSITWGPLWAIS